MQRIRITYSKEDSLKFISHKELIRAFEKAIRRAEIPVAYSQGYNPHMKIDFGIPLQVGISSDFELMDIYMDKDMDMADIAKRLSKALPQGISLTTIKHVDLKYPSIQEEVKATYYQIDFNANQAVIEQRINEILDKKEIIIKRRTKSGEKEVNIRPLIHKIIEEGDLVEAELECSSASTLKASEFISLFHGIEIDNIKRMGFSLKVTR